MLNHLSERSRMERYEEYSRRKEGCSVAENRTDETAKYIKRHDGGDPGDGWRIEETTRLLSMLSCVH